MKNIKVEPAAQWRPIKKQKMNEACSTSKGMIEIRKSCRKSTTQCQRHRNSSFKSFGERLGSLKGRKPKKATRY